jgi:trehalose 6-phosphate synthase
VVLLSNRGPLSFSIGDDGALAARRGAGGLVSGLAPLVSGTDAIWLAAAMSGGDRRAAEDGVIEAEGLRVRLLALDPDTHRSAYDVVCNATLWFAHHGLFDASRRPRPERRWREAWEAYRVVNHAFADAAAEAAPEGAAVLVQDYHLCLVAPRLRDARPDLRLVHFAHTPFAVPEWFRAVPDHAARELLEGLAAHHACGFHTARWARDFAACCAAAPGGPVAAPATFVAALAADEADLAKVVGSDTCAAALAELDTHLGDRAFVLRVDRLELSKNLLRGFNALDLLFEEHPGWIGRLVVGAFVYPSRQGLPEYLAYRQEVEGVVRRLNERWATPDGWVPVLYDSSDDFPRSVAALRRADVLLVNPIRDGLNLVALEGMLVNERDAALVLSTEAGAWDLLGDAGAIGVNPFDVAATADALHAALALPASERTERARRLRAAAGVRTPADWLADQLAAAG